MGNWKREPQSLMPTAEPTRDDVVFFAGFYEGEGSACKHGDSAIVVQVPQKDPEMIVRGRSLWGGSIRPSNDRGVSVWVMSGDRARRFLIDVYPFLSSRRKAQIEKAGGLILTGHKLMTHGGMEVERQIARKSMTEAQRHTESARRWDEKNRERKLASTRAWQKANREHLNELQRERRRRIREQVSVQNELQSERSLLVN